VAGCLTEGGTPRLAPWRRGLGNESVLREAEDRDQPYLTKLRLTNKVKALIKRSSAPPRGERRDMVGEGVEDTLRLAGWSRTRSVIVLRRPLTGEMLMTGTDADQSRFDFMESEVPTKRYEYAVLAVFRNWRGCAAKNAVISRRPSARSSPHPDTRAGRVCSDSRRRLRGQPQAQLCEDELLSRVGVGCTETWSACRNLGSVVGSAVLPLSTSYASGKPSGVTMSAMTTCTQSGRLSRLYPCRRKASSPSGGGHSKYVLVRS
jgi:hypothetical protein